MKAPNHKIEKVCSCGRKITEIPDKAREWIDEGQLIGWCWECDCKSTLFVPISKIRKVA